MNHLDKLEASLENMNNEIHVDEETAQKARVALSRMIDFKK